MVTSGALSNRPLHPLTVGGIFERSLQLYRANFWPLVGIVAVVQIAVAVLSALVRLSVAGSVANPSVSTTFAAVVVGVFTVLFVVIASFLQSGALTLAIADDYLGQPITIERAYAAAGHRLGALIGTSLLVGVLLVLMVIVVVDIPFAIYFGIRWAFIAQIVMLENLAGTEAMRRSSTLVSGYWWRTLGVLLATVIVVAIIGAVISSILAAILGGGLLGAVVNLIVQILLAPFYSAIITLLYFDLRIRKEQLTHDMIAGTSTPPTVGGLSGLSPL